MPSDPQLHPDGRRVAFTVSRVNLDEDRYDRSIWLHDGEARRFTQGPRDASPRWSPDGRWLAFLRRRDDDAKAQVHVMPADGGEARVLTDLPLGATELRWSPDSSRLVVVAPTWISRVAGWDDAERARRARRITRLRYRDEGVGWVHDRRNHLYLVDRDAEPGGERCLTPGDDFSELSPSWHPDGDRIAFLADRAEDRELEPGHEVWTLTLSGERSERVLPRGWWEGVAYSPDGALHAWGLADAMAWPAPIRTYRLEAGELVDLTGHLDRSVAPIPGPVPAGPQFVKGGFLTVVEDAGRVGVARVDADGTVAVLDGDRCVTGIAPRPDGTAFAFTVTSPGEPGELHWWEDGDERVLTALNADFLASADLRPVEHFRFERDGAEVDAWAVLPPGDGSAPVLLNIHGGPTSQYGFSFFDEFQVYASAGYLVVGCNPRGSSGRGADWADAVVGVWDDPESVDTMDLLAAVDATLARYQQADASRLGVMGGSYGGYATARVLTVTDRFRSAVVERGLLNWESFSGTSDIGHYFDRLFVGSSLPDGWQRLRAASPTTDAHGITTPTLVLHSEQDLRCPIEQAEQFFAALRRAGVESEFVRFPDENHELSRAGAPLKRLERLDIILDWHGRHLDLPWTVDSLAAEPAGEPDE